jgi:hypothetical protein
MFHCECGEDCDFVIEDTDWYSADIERRDNFLTQSIVHPQCSSLKNPKTEIIKTFKNCLLVNHHYWDELN